MSSTENRVKENYMGGKEDKRATQSRYSQTEFYYTVKHIGEYITKDTTVLEIGCGTGYYGMVFSGQCKEYLGIDITPENISIFKEKIQNGMIENVRAQVGDATDLSSIPDGSFNVVLCLGPLYHLPPEERELVFAECERVCKKQGIAVFAYINKAGVYAGACVFGNFYPNEKANEMVLGLGKDDMRPDLFFYTMPEEMETAAKKHGFFKIKNLGTDFFIFMNVINGMSDEKFELLKPLLDQMTSYESCTGMSNHAILICKKQ